MHEVGQQWSKQNPPKVSEKKGRDKRFPNFARKAQKCNERLMYKTKGVEPNSKVEMNKIQARLSKFLLNITLKQSLNQSKPFFHSPLTPDYITSPIKPIWIKEWLISLLSWDSRMKPIHACDCKKKIYTKKRILQVSHLHIWEENSLDQELVENAQTIVTVGYILC